MNPLTTVSAAARRAFPTRGAPPMAHLATLEPPTPSVNVTFNATIIETGTESYRLARARAGTAKPAA